MSSLNDKDQELANESRCSLLQAVADTVLIALAEALECDKSTVQRFFQDKTTIKLDCEKLVLLLTVLDMKVVNRHQRTLDAEMYQAYKIMAKKFMLLEAQGSEEL